MTPARLAELVRDTAAGVLAERGLDPAALPDDVGIAPTATGGYATPVALRTARRAGIGATELAGWLAGALAGRPGVRRATVSGPGFVDVALDPVPVIANVRVVSGYVCQSPRHRSRVLYAHARLAQLARHAADLGVDPDDRLIEESALIRTLAETPPDLDRLAAEVHEFLDARGILPEGDAPTTDRHRGRVALAAAARHVLAGGLRGLGITPPERM